MSKTGKRVFDEAFDEAKSNQANLMLVHIMSPGEEGCPDISSSY
jgi:hypothetical protein